MAERVGASVDMRLLPSFLVLAEELHFSRAADRLHIAQPALSQQMARLERQVGALLFDRPPQPIALTEAGRTLLARIAPALSLVDQGVSEARDVVRGESGALSLHYLSSFAARLIPRIAAALRGSHPEVTLTLHEAGLAEQIAALRAGRAHVGLIHTSPDLPLDVSDLRVETLASGPRMLAAPAGHALAAQDRVLLADAAHEPFILPSGDAHTGYRAAVFGACARYDFVPAVAAHANDTGVMLELVAAGVGIAFVPWIAMPTRPEGVVVLPLEGEQTRLVALRARHAPQTATALIQAARGAVRQLTGSRR